MTERRVGIPYDRLKVKADVLGIELNELILDKFDACVDVIVSHDIDRLKSSDE